MRRKFMAGNWKMYNGPAATREFFAEILSALSATKEKEIVDNINSGNIEIAIFPPSISLEAAVTAKRGIPISVGGQNVHWEKQGAFTGEISVPMLKEVGCAYVIIGHSERRHIFHETDESLHQKLLAATAGGLVAVFCVGELLKDRENGDTFDVVRRQLLAGLKSMDASTVKDKIIVAYEPVWAIGTGKTARDEDAQEVCAFIRKVISDTFGEGVADKVLILYGGSVKPENTAGIMSQQDIDGVLVGGASLKPESFLAIVKAAIA